MMTPSVGQTRKYLHSCNTLGLLLFVFAAQIYRFSADYLELS